MGFEDVDWEAIYAKLPVGKDQKKERMELFDLFDPNSNGILSLAEIDKQIRDILQLDEIFDSKPAIMRAFQISKDCIKRKKGDVREDYVDRREFKFFLQALRQYFEYWVAFKRVDADGDRRISYDEFLEAVPIMEVWCGAIGDSQAEFDKIDSNDGGLVLFEEFCNWAIAKGLDLEDDDDVEGLEDKLAAT